MWKLLKDSHLNNITLMSECCTALWRCVMSMLLFKHLEWSALWFVSSDYKNHGKVNSSFVYFRPSRSPRLHLHPEFSSTRHPLQCSWLRAKLQASPWYPEPGKLSLSPSLSLSLPLRLRLSQMSTMNICRAACLPGWATTPPTPVSLISDQANKQVHSLFIVLSYKYKVELK